MTEYTPAQKKSLELGKSISVTAGAVLERHSF